MFVQRMEQITNVQLFVYAYVIQPKYIQLY